MTATRMDAFSFGPGAPRGALFPDGAPRDAAADGAPARPDSGQPLGRAPHRSPRPLAG